MFAIPHPAEPVSEITDIELYDIDPAAFDDAPYEVIESFPEPAPFDLARESPAARLARERRDAAILQRQSRAKHKATVEAGHRYRLGQSKNPAQKPILRHEQGRWSHYRITSMVEDCLAGCGLHSRRGDGLVS